MANINGISVKGIKQFLGHEGEPLYQGNLYLNNKKIGFWSQDSHGGCDNFVLDGKYSEQRINSVIDALNPDKAFRGGTEERPFVIKYNLELLLGDYITLMLDEKEYKKAVKAGYAGIVIATDGYHCTTWRLSERFMAMSDDMLLNELRDDIARTKESFFKENKYCQHTIRIYRSLADFEIGKPIEVADISA